MSSVDLTKHSPGSTGKQRVVVKPGERPRILPRSKGAKSAPKAGISRFLSREPREKAVPGQYLG
jgi:hypothetical protein